MSEISFQSEREGRAEVRGWERHRAHSLCCDLLMVALGAHFEHAPARLLPLLAPSSGLRNVPRSEFAQRFRTALSTGLTGGILIGERRVSAFTLALNTALVMGSDPLRLLARLHGQGDDHPYVEGPNRAWLADIVAEGRASGLLRAGSGWEDVERLLRAASDAAVVVSLSTGEPFPDRYLAREQGTWAPPEPADVEDDGYEDESEIWYRLDRAEQWQVSLAALRKAGPASGLELRPETWRSFRFHHGLSGFDVARFSEREGQ